MSVVFGIKKGEAALRAASPKQLKLKTGYYFTTTPTTTRRSKLLVPVYAGCAVTI